MDEGEEPKSLFAEALKGAEATWGLKGRCFFSGSWPNQKFVWNVVIFSFQRGGKWKENVSEEMGANGFRSEIYRAPIWMHEVRSSLAVLDKERRSTNRAEYG